MADRRRKPREMQRYPLGLNYAGSSRKGVASVCVLYRVVYDDGTVGMEYGRRLHNMPGFLPPGAKTLPEDVRPDLSDLMAIFELAQHRLLEVCALLDEKPKRRARRG